MKAVLRNTKPYWFYLICEGKKTIEVVKGDPKATDWNRTVELYCSKDMESFNRIPKEYQEKYRKYLGKVGARFICDKVDDFYCASVPYQRENNLGYGQFIDNGVYKVNGWFEGIVFERNDRYIDTMLNNNNLKEMCLTAQELFDYIGVGKHLYGWHISDLQIYDKPKELSEFCIPCKVSCENCKNPLYFERGCEEKGKKIITRPPQSYMFVEGLQEENR